MTTLGLAFRLVVSLGVVVGIMWVAARLLRDKVTGESRHRRRGQLIHIIERRGLQKNTSIAVVQVGNEVMILGITDHTVNLLTTTDENGLASIDLTGEGRTKRSNDDAGHLSGDGQLDELSRSARMPLRAASAIAGPPNNAWKLILQSMRDHTVRR